MTYVNDCFTDDTGGTVYRFEIMPESAYQNLVIPVMLLSPDPGKGNNGYAIVMIDSMGCLRPSIALTVIRILRTVTGSCASILAA